MKSSKISVEEVVKRIKSAMAARGEHVSVSDPSSPLQDGIGLSPNLLDDLDREVYANNQRWNLITELPITSHRKFTGPILVFGRKLVVKYLRWYIHPPLDQQRAFNGSVTRSINVLKNLVYSVNGQLLENARRVNLVEDQLRTIPGELTARIERDNASLFVQNRELSEQIEALKAEAETANSELKKAIESNTAELISLKGEFDRAIENVSHLLAVPSKDQIHLPTEDLVKLIDDKTAALSQRIDSEHVYFLSTIKRYDRGVVTSTPPVSRSETPLTKADPNKIEALDLDYFLFEEKFRGSRGDIKDRQRRYVDLFRERGDVVDIGCGRGEFVELLLENGISVTGIDINDDMVAYCAELNLPVIKVDAFSYLRSQDDGSIGGIFASQVVEHLSVNDLILFIGLASTKLKPGGLLVLETINPNNIVAISTWFYMDLSHVRPLHPLTAQFLLESAGLADVRFIYSNPVPEKAIPALRIGGVTGNLEEFNRSIEHVNSLLYGPQDYAVIGVKKSGADS